MPAYLRRLAFIFVGVIITQPAFAGPLSRGGTAESQWRASAASSDSRLGRDGDFYSTQLAGRPVVRPVDPSTYVLGPGDGFAITIRGGSTEVLRARVGPEGELLIPGIATVHVAGRFLQDAREPIRRALDMFYRDVEIDISLVELRNVEVHVVGRVVNPGAYVGTALDRTSQLIKRAGGLLDNASQRAIEIVRRDGETLAVDLMRYERLSELELNPPILDGDIIRVPWRKGRVEISGAVEAPGRYEFIPGDTIARLIDLAGGPTYGARVDTVEVRTFVDDQRTRSAEPAGYESARRLIDGDQVYVREAPDFRALTAVSVEGEVRFPGPYGINEGEDSLRDVLRRAGGFTEEASLTEAILVRTEGIDKVDLEFERLKIIPIEDMTKSEYAYFKSKSREKRGVVVVDFVRLASGDESQDRFLRNADRIIVPRSRAMVTVSGTVTHPGLVTFVPNRKAGYYIAQAGGFASTADRGSARVIRGVTGEWEPTSDAGPLVPGDEVWVPEKPERDWWQFAQEAVRFAASVATVYLVIDQATR